MSFFTVPTLTFGVLYCFFVIAHDRRRTLHLNAMQHSDWRIDFASSCAKPSLRLRSQIPDPGSGLELCHRHASRVGMTTSLNIMRSDYQADSNPAVRDRKTSRH